MKFLYFIFAFYTFYLAFVPCGDVRDCNDVAQHEDAGQHQEEACPPFCVCACCGTITSIPDKIYFAFVSIPVVTDGISFAEGQPLAVSFSIWQPPKI